MEDFNSNNSNLANTVGGLKIFSGRVPSEFKDWRKQNCLVLRHQSQRCIRHHARAAQANHGNGGVNR